MFNATEFDSVLKKDNPTYERVKVSDLNALYALLQKRGFTADQVASEMKKISGEKWQKYKQTQAYLIREIVGLANLVLPKLVKFRTKSLIALPGGNIKHDAVWQSDSGKLQDLAYVFVREKVYWGPPSAAAKQYLHPAYQTAGEHFGVGNAAYSPGSAGNMSDTHSVTGAWAPNVHHLKGPGSISHTCKQVYQWSMDKKATWLDIPNSTYEIIREVSQQGSKIKMTITKKSVPPLENCSNSIFV